MKPHTEVIVSVLAYSLCSGTLGKDVYSCIYVKFAQYGYYFLSSFLVFHRFQLFTCFCKTNTSISDSSFYLSFFATHKNYHHYKVLLNKLILHHLPYPSFVVTFQLCATISFIYIAKHCYNLPVDELQWKYIVPYLYYIVAFALGVYCNMKSLSISNVETVIVFRALSPCLVSFLDTFFLGREYPSVRSWISMGTIVAGTYGYASYDTQFQTQGLSAYTY
jgi:uncharacterized membrane protein